MILYILIIILCDLRNGNFYYLMAVYDFYKRKFFIERSLLCCSNEKQTEYFLTIASQQAHIMSNYNQVVKAILMLLVSWCGYRLDELMFTFF